MSLSFTLHNYTHRIDVQPTLYTATLWNKLPDKIKETQSLDTLKLEFDNYIN